MSKYTYRENIYDFYGNAIGCQEYTVPNRIVEQIRADAIDECEKAIDKVFLYTDNNGIDRYADYCQVNRSSMRTMLEQLKEENK